VTASTVLQNLSTFGTSTKSILVVLRTKKELPVLEYIDRNIWIEVTWLRVAD
jgi:hypothetical protein